VAVATEYGHGSFVYAAAQKKSMVKPGGKEKETNKQERGSDARNLVRFPLPSLPGLVEYS